MAAELSLQTRVSGCLAIGGVAGHDRELTCRQLGGRDSGRASGRGSGRSWSARWASSVPCLDPDSTASAFFSGSSFSVRSQFARDPWRSSEASVCLWSMQNCDERIGKRRWRLRTTATTLLGHFSCLAFERAGKRESISGVPLTPIKPWIRQWTSQTAFKGDERREVTCRAAPPPQQRGFERRGRARGGRQRQRKPQDGGGGVAAPSRKQQEQQVEEEEHAKEEEEEDGEWDISEEEFEKLFDELEVELQEGVRMGEYTEADLGDFDIDEEELRQFAREFGEEEGASAEYAENENQSHEDDGEDGDEETEESDGQQDEEEKQRGRYVQEAATASLGKDRGDLPSGTRTAPPRHSITSASSMDAYQDESADEGENFHHDDDDDDGDEGEDGEDGKDLVSMEEDLESPEGVRTVHLEPWQLKRLAKALDKGRRHVNIKSLAGDTKLDRSDVLAFLKNPPVELLVQFSVGRENQAGVQSGTEEGGSLSVSDANRRTKQPRRSQFEDNEGSRRRDDRMRRGGRDVNKRMKKVDIATLERVYERTKRPTDAMVMNLVELTHLPRKEILSWFSARREREQSHNGARTLGDLQTFVPDSFRPKT